MPPPPPAGAELPLTAQLLTVIVDATIIIPPPPELSPLWPLVMVRPEMLTVLLLILNTRLVVLGKLPFTARLAGPEPLMLRLLVMSNSPLVRIIAPNTPVASMVSPFVALASAARNDPAPLSAALVTEIVAALTLVDPAHSSVRTSAGRKTCGFIRRFLSS